MKMLVKVSIFIFLVIGSICLSSTLERVLVTKVIDGDTVYVLFDNGEECKVRLIGVDCPEITNGKDEYYGKEAAEFTTQEILNKTVYLQKDVSETDMYERLLRYIWLVDTQDFSDTNAQKYMFNAVLVSKGYAKAAEYKPDTKYAALFSLLEAQAKAAQIGIWQPQLPQQSKTATQNIEVLEYSSSVKRGGTAYVKIKGIPGTRYNCSVKYKSGYSSAAGLGVKTADDKGYVSWSWKIGSSTTQGSWPIIITNLSNSSDTVTINFYVY